MPSSKDPLSQVLHALADPTRRALLQQLLNGDSSVTGLAQYHEMSLAAVSKHITVLERAGLVSRLRQGSTHWIQLTPSALQTTTTWLSQFTGEQAPQQLDRLAQMLAADPDT
ncbi:MAG: metalloregulator ArsR/SmtB family transcription factor [Pseudomonadota bacterium]